MLSRIQKTILNTFLEDIHSDFQVELVSYYHFLVTKICDNIKAIEGRYKKIDNVETDSGFDIQADHFGILGESECDEVVNRTKLRFIEELIKRRSKLPTKTVLDIVEALFKGMNSQEQYEK